jgi:hypothetical protein
VGTATVSRSGPTDVPQCNPNPSELWLLSKICTSSEKRAVVRETGRNCNDESRKNSKNEDIDRNDDDGR